MSKELNDAALAGLSALIEAELKTDAPTRFVRAARICKHAHDLLQMNVVRVGDIPMRRPGLLGAQAADEFGVDVLGNDGMYQPYGVGAVMNGAMNMGGMAPVMDMAREIMSVLKPKPVDEAVAAVKKILPDAYERLDKLFKLRDNAPDEATKQRIMSQIDQTLKEMETKHGQSDVAGAIVLRGPETGDADEGLVQPPGGTGDIERIGSAQEAAGLCDQEGLVRQDGDDQRGSDHARGVDREGGEGTHEGPQTRT